MCKISTLTRINSILPSSYARMSHWFNFHLKEEIWTWNHWEFQINKAFLSGANERESGKRIWKFFSLKNNFSSIFSDFVVDLDSREEKIEQIFKWIWFVKQNKCMNRQKCSTLPSTSFTEQFQFAIEESQLSYRLLLSGWNRLSVRARGKFTLRDIMSAIKFPTMFLCCISNLPSLGFR